MGDDLDGNPALFVRVVLSDKASRPKGLRTVADRVTDRIRQDPRIAETGLLSYVWFRSKSEQAQLKDKAWS